MSNLLDTLFAGTAGAMQAADQWIAKDQEVKAKFALEEWRLQKNKEIADYQHEYDVELKNIDATNTALLGATKQGYESINAEREQDDQLAQIAARGEENRKTALEADTREEKRQEKKRAEIIAKSRSYTVIEQVNRVLAGVGAEGLNEKKDWDATETKAQTASRLEKAAVLLRERGKNDLADAIDQWNEYVINNAFANADDVDRVFDEVWKSVYKDSAAPATTTSDLTNKANTSRILGVNKKDG